MCNFYNFFPKKTVFALICATVLCSCSDKKWYKSEGAVWGTTYHITYKAAVDLSDSITAAMSRVEKSLSPFAPQSLISRINNGEDIPVDTLLKKVFVAAQFVSAESGFAFDPTVAPAVNLWGYGYRSGSGDPASGQIDSIKSLIGFYNTYLENDMIVRDNPATEFDFSAITKGFGCDVVGETLRRNGCTDYLVEIGGEMSLAGLNPRGEKWRVMIDTPEENAETVRHERLAVIAVTDCGVATSGNYRNFRITASGKTWHTIDPRTCRPAVTPTLSATVIAPDAMLADAFATACMVMQPDSAVAMTERQRTRRISAMLVVADSTGTPQILTTAGFPAIQ